MWKTRAARVVAVLSLAGPTLTACGDRPGPTGPDDLPTDPAALVLQVTEFPSGPLPWGRGSLPRFSLYGGGRVVVPAGGDGALRSAREYRLDAGEYHDLVRRAYAAGLNRSRELDHRGRTDAGLLLLRLGTPDGERTTRIIAPEAGNGRDRDRIRDLVRSLPDTPTTAAEYRPRTLAVLAIGGMGAGGAPPRPWPLRPLTDGIDTSEGLCGLVSGTQLTTVTRLVDATRAADSRWTSGGHTLAVSVRPLLPHQRACADLDRR